MGRATPRLARRAPLAMLAFFASLAMSRQAHATIPFGPWVFDDRAFADDVEQLEAGTIYLYCDATDLRDALLGFSPDRQIVNIGMGGNANDFALSFIDLRAINGPGDDLVFFETAWSYEGYEIALRPVGGSFTSLIAYPVNAFVTLTEPGCATVLGLPIEMDDHGLAAGTVVDAIRFRSLATGTGFIEGDPLMAGVLNGVEGCDPAQDRDADTVPDACDCMPDGNAGGPGEPENVRALADKISFSFETGPADPGIAWRLMRGDLAPLRATGLYQMRMIDEVTTVEPCEDLALPGIGTPFYYLVTAVLCEGGESTLGFDSLGRERVLSP